MRVDTNSDKRFEENKALAKMTNNDIEYSIMHRFARIYIVRKIDKRPIKENIKERDQAMSTRCAYLSLFLYS